MADRPADRRARLQDGGAVQLVAAWTDLLIPITLSTRPDGWTLPAGIIQMQTGFRIYRGALMSGGLYLTLPTFLIAFLAQKYLTRGLRASFST